ncbi:MAG: AraC family transcriptional regulator [Clostridia bacterium]|nr:AraC family transcriptional regulator [Clostridia bacterium]
MNNATIDLENFSFSYLEYREMDPFHLKRHIHPTYEILFVTEGKIDYVIEDKSYALEKGDLLLIRPAQYHFVRDIVAPPYRRFCFHFLPDFTGDDKLIENVFDRGEMFTLREGSAAEKLMFLFKELLTQLPQNAREPLCKDMLHAILLSLLTLKKAPKKNSAVIEKNCWKILDYINVNLTTINNAEDIANALFYSKSYINHLFKNELNISVMQYIRNKRILLAHKMIGEGAKPTDVFLKCGFSNYVTFYRAYCQYFGFSPSDNKRKR